MIKRQTLNTMPELIGQAQAVRRLTARAIHVQYSQEGNGVRV